MTINKKKISPQEGKLSEDPIAGLDNTEMEEKQPVYASSPSEKLIEGQNNTRIILGRDRPGDFGSGYGGRGHTRAGAIDIVVGLQGWDPEQSGEIKDGSWISGRAHKNFGSVSKGVPGDAARIYISQRANIDEYFDLVEGGVGNSIADSAIGMCADSVRIIARKGVKIVTGTTATKTSKGGKSKVIYGIDLIAGNEDVDSGLKLPTESPGRNLLQPIPKGENLLAALESMNNRIEGLNYIVSSTLINISKLVSVVLEPRVGANAGGPVVATLTLGISTCSGVLADIQRYSADLAVQRQALNAFKMDYLNISGAKYINSRHNRVN